MYSKIRLTRPWPPVLQSKDSDPDSAVSIPRPRLRKPDHKRAQSDTQKFVPGFSAKTDQKGQRPQPSHQRSYSQNFDLEELQMRTVETWEKKRQKSKSPVIMEVDEEDCSESEEVIRKILREREQGFPRTSVTALDPPPKREDSSIVGLQASMSSLLSQREANARKTDFARTRLKQEILKLIQTPSSESSRVDTPDTVITIKSSLASTTTVLELNDGSENADSSIQEFRPEDTAIQLEERKESPLAVFDKSFSKGSEADNTVIADAEALIDSSDLSSSQVFSGKRSLLQRFRPNNHKIIKNAVNTICLAGEANKKNREEVMKLVDARKSAFNFVIAFKGTLGRHELGALYEHDQTEGLLRKVYGPGSYPDLATSALVQSCYRYDSSAREFRSLQNRRFTFGMDAVSLHRRL